MGNKDSTFENQAMLILHQGRGPSWKKTPSRPTVDPYEVDRIIRIDRNPNGQIYIAPDLNTSCHLAASKEVAEEIVHRIQFFYGTNPVLPEVVHITPSMSYDNFEESGIFVQNSKSTVSRNGKTDTIDHSSISKLFQGICTEGIFGGLKFTEKHRSNEENGESPVLHFGYSKSNCSQYPSLRTTGWGHVAAAPILSGIDGMSEKCKTALLKLISAAELMCPKGHQTFILEEENSYRIDYRTELNELFGVSMNKATGFPKNNKDPYITCEGFTIIIPLILACHRDFLNDFINGKFCDRYHLNSFSVSKFLTIICHR